MGNVTLRLPSDGIVLVVTKDIIMLDVVLTIVGLNVTERLTKSPSSKAIIDVELSASS